MSEPRPLSPRDLEELASRLRAAITQLAFHLRGPATHHGVTPTRFAALSTLTATGPRRPGDLAHDLGLSPAGMSGLTRALTDTGWVEREPDPDDHRAYRLRLTVAGETTVRRFRTHGADQLADDIATLSAEQQARLLDALPALDALVDRHTAPDSAHAPQGTDPIRTNTASQSRTRVAGRPPATAGGAVTRTRRAAGTTRKPAGERTHTPRLRVGRYPVTRWGAQPGGRSKLNQHHGEQLTREP